MLEYYERELDALFAEAALKLSAEEYENLCEWLHEQGVV